MMSAGQLPTWKGPTAQPGQPAPIHRHPTSVRCCFRDVFVCMRRHVRPQWFDKVDTDLSGHITAPELQAALMQGACVCVWAGGRVGGLCARAQ